jgi:hypothetical protein
MLHAILTILGLTADPDPETPIGCLSNEEIDAL